MSPLLLYYFIIVLFYYCIISLYISFHFILSSILRFYLYLYLYLFYSLMLYFYPTSHGASGTKTVSPRGILILILN